MGRTWYAPWISASAYALPILAGAKMTQMENRIVLTRFKDGYGPVGAEDLHQLQRAWELHHRVIASESVTQHTISRKETRWPGYYYRADHPKLDDADWHCFTLSQYDHKTGKRQRCRRSRTSRRCAAGSAL